MSDNDSHPYCYGGCMPSLSANALANKGKRNGLRPGQLEQVLQLVDGRCMVCLRSHAMVIDTTTRSQKRRPRGVVCRNCKQRIAVHEGSYGPDEPLFVGCRGGPSGDAEWEPRMAAAIAQYLQRTEQLESCQKNRDRFDILIQDLVDHGTDPHRVWDGAPVSELPQLPAQKRDPFLVYDYAARPPLTRDRCANDCRDHAEHVYIACFDEPVTLRDADVSSPVSHYVGWTRQPPIRRVNQHGAICRKSLVAIIPGTAAEEELLKNDEQCPRCRQPLQYR
ncbi:hypothetical protein [Nocardia wallacei]|uniref:hypothetical protein n=1 Tax=Nocardia wallacei TaxID=480035 RepID=UPI00245669A5|nr:hypothetical protein [Nocardia wallacei]